MRRAVTDELNQQNPSLLDRIKESPRTVSALIIILIVAAAVYAFSGKEQPAEEQNNEQATPTVEATASTEPSDDTAKETDKNSKVVASKAPQTTTVTQEELTNKAKELPTVTKTDKGYSEVAQKGDGLTHLARRATTRWLSENQAGYTVTNEHRIYIEDYIRRHVEGGKQVKIGESRTVSYDLIAEAVQKAGQLNERQLQNLTRYSSVLK